MRGIRAISYRLKEQNACPEITSKKVYDPLNNSGQIKAGSRMGILISEYASNSKYKRYLEIGTWNGRGSTFCFYNGFCTKLGCVILFGT